MQHDLNLSHLKTWLIQLRAGPLQESVKKTINEVLRSRAAVLCWLASALIPFSIVTYDYFFYPHVLLYGILISVPCCIACILVYFSLNTNFISKHIDLPFFILIAIVANFAASANLQLTGGGKGSFFFPYLLIYLTMAVYYSGRLQWVIATAMTLIFGYIASEVWAQRNFYTVTVISNIIYLVDASVICLIANRIIYTYFVRDKIHQIELETANTQLQSLDQAKSRFFSNITHEFRTPLVSLAATVQLIRDKDLGDPYLTTLLNSSFTSLEDMLDNVNDLLIKTRSEKSMTEMKWSEINIADFLQKSLTIFGPLAGKRNNRLQFTTRLQDEKQPLLVYVDRSQLKKIINNLVGNAIKFTKDGVIEVTLDQTDTHCVIRVRDTGHGIPKEDLPTIFNPFMQASNNPLSDVEGTGLGLAMVKDFVEKHGGTVTVESALGTGTTFTFTLPLGDQHVDHTKLDTSEVLEEDANARIHLNLKSFDDIDFSLFSKHDQKRSHILLVEDNPRVLQALAYVLKDHYNLHFAKDGQDGFEQAQVLKPDLMISDIMMPNMNGYELVQAVKHNPELAMTPIILLTSKADIESKIQGFEVGADEYLSKPFNNREVLTRIQTLLKKREMDMRFALTEKMASLGIIVAGVAHEINNPISGAKDSLDDAKEIFQKLEEGSLSLIEAKNYIFEMFENVDRGVERVCHITQSLTGFVRQGATGFSQNNIHQSLDASLAIAYTTRKSDIQFHKDYRLEEKVICNINQLNQVFFNLLQNAIHALEDQKNGVILITTRKENNEAIISIKDSGHGIPLDIQQRIFDPFFTTKDVGEGMGFGLHVSERIVSEHGGTLTVRSAPHDGAEFTIRIPINGKGGQRDESTPFTAAGDRGMEKVRYPYRR